MTSRLKIGLALFLVLIGAVLLSIGLSSFIGTNAFVNSSESVRGRVLALQNHGGTEYLYISFTDKAGDPRDVTSIANSSFEKLRKGQVVPLRYNPANPKEAQVDSFVYLWLRSYSLMIPGLVFLLAGVTLAGLGLHAGSKRRTPLTSEGQQRVSHSDSARQNREIVERVSPTAQRTPRADNPDQRILSSAQSVATEQSQQPAPQNLPSGQDVFGILRPFIDDLEVSDIIVSGYSQISISRGGKHCPVAVRFSSQKDYEDYIERLLMLAGVTYSTSKPVVDGMVGNSIRIHAVNKVLCDGGPFLTIRISRFRSVHQENLIKAGMAPREIFQYLSLMVQSGQTIFISGEVGTGKTTLARALGSCISKNESILVIEDTPEIKIEHPHVRYMHTREANIAGVGRINPSACIRAGMRMAMNRIIFGEIRDSEAAEAFIDVCVSGHPGISTIHARSARDALNRLELLLGREQGGVDRMTIRGEIAAAVQVIVYLKICRLTGLRRIVEIKEIAPGLDLPSLTSDLIQYQVVGNQGVWKLKEHRSLFDERLVDAGHNSILSTLPDVLTL